MKLKKLNNLKLPKGSFFMPYNFQVRLFSYLHRLLFATWKVFQQQQIIR